MCHRLTTTTVPCVTPRQQDVCTRYKDDPGYCVAKRVRNQVYYDTAKDLGCFGRGNQLKAGECMRAATKVFAGDGNDGLPTEVVKAMLQY
ncbi:unnamed protein product [Ectocarpus sp. CCAP 1310/34]|nr:unnamed protein product [Ectocarpus sp. CCAP 1310/34]